MPAFRNGLTWVVWVLAMNSFAQVDWGPSIGVAYERLVPRYGSDRSELKVLPGPGLAAGMWYCTNSAHDIRLLSGVNFTFERGAFERPPDENGQYGYGAVTSGEMWVCHLEVPWYMAVRLFHGFDLTPGIITYFSTDLNATLTRSSVQSEYQDGHWVPVRRDEFLSYNGDNALTGLAFKVSLGCAYALNDRFMLHATYDTDLGSAAELGIISPNFKRARLSVNYKLLPLKRADRHQ